MTDQLPNPEHEFMGIFISYHAKKKDDFLQWGYTNYVLNESKFKFLNVDNCPEIIQSLISKGYVYNKQDGFDLYLTEKGEKYIKEHMSP